MKIVNFLTCLKYVSLKSNSGNIVIRNYSNNFNTKIVNCHKNFKFKMQLIFKKQKNGKLDVNNQKLNNNR